MKKRVLSLVLAMLMLMSLLVGCGGGGTATSSKVDPGTASTNPTASEDKTPEDKTPEVPAEPKILRTTGTVTNTLNPHTVTGNPASNIPWFYGYLYYYFPNSDGTGVAIQPELAASEPVDVNGDGLVWNIPIHPDAKWDNGDPITAKTFEYSFKMCMEPVRPSSYATQMATNTVIIKNAKAFIAGEKAWEEVGIKAIDGNILQITLEEKSNAINVMSHFVSFHTAPVHEELYEKCLSADRTTSTYGTTVDLTHFCGAYVVDEWVDSNTLSLKKNENYPRADQIKLDQWIIRTADSAAGLQMFENGEIDIVSIGATTAEQYAEDPRRISSYVRYVRQIDFCDTNTDYPIIANMNFKKALFYAIDREAVAKLTGGIVADFAVPRTTKVNSDGTRFRDLPEAQAYLPENHGYDPALAKQYFETALKEEGLTSVSLEFLHNTSAIHNTIAEYLQEQFNAVFEGKLELKLVSMADKPRLEIIKSTATNPKAYQLTLAAWAMSNTDYNATKIFETMTTSYARRNAPYHNETINTLYAESLKAENALDMKKLTELAIEMEKAYLEDVVCVPIVEDLSYHLVADHVIFAYDQADTSIGWGFMYADIAQ